jgi:ribosomal protein L28
MTSRVFRPNLHKQLVHVGGDSVRVKICTRCLRSQTKGA